MEEQVGLLDVVNAVLAGPRGQPPQQPQSSHGGMSPVVMAVLGVLAYKALQGRSSAQPGDGSAGASPSGGSGAGSSGGLEDILGGLGSLFGGAAGARGGLGNLAGGLGGGASAGNVLSSGLSKLINDLTNAGHGQAARSWVGTGPNHPIAPNDLGAALGDDAIQSLSNQTGMSRPDLLAALSRHLPEIVNRLTPNGRLPSEAEAQQIAQGDAPTQRAAGGAG